MTVGFEREKSCYKEVINNLFSKSRGEKTCVLTTSDKSPIRQQ